MHPILFWVFSLIMLGFGLLVVLHRHPVSSALSMVVSFLALAALFVSLDAFFIGVIQVLVYTGAVMVLFLFIIMLLDLQAEERRRVNLVAAIGGGLITLMLIAQLVGVLERFPAGHLPMPPLADRAVNDVREIGILLFTSYNLPFQVVAALILVATVGVVLLSKKELK